MKISRTDYSMLDSFRNHKSSMHDFSRRQRKKDEFKNILETYLKESTSDNLEEFRVILPKHGRFWDNGYEDIE